MKWSYIRNIYFFLVSLSIIIILNSNIYADSPPNSPPGVPDDSKSRMYTLEDVYNLATRRTFTPPKTGQFVFPEKDQSPNDGNGTGHTLNDIYESVRTHIAVPQPTGTFDSPTEGHGVPWTKPRFEIKFFGCNDADEGCNETNDTVVDNLTRLEWRRTYAYIKVGEAFADPIIYDVEAQKIQALIDEIRKYNEGTGEGPGDGNYDNWRLPTPKELFTLCDPSYTSPSMANILGTGQATKEGSPFVYKRTPLDAKTRIAEELWMTSMISERPKPAGEEEHISIYAFVFERGLITTVDTMWVDYAQTFCVRNIKQID